MTPAAGPDSTMNTGRSRALAAVKTPPLLCITSSGATKPARGHETRSRGLALDDGVGGDGRAVHDQLYLTRRQSRGIDDLSGGVQEALRRIVRCRRHFRD